MRGQTTSVAGVWFKTVIYAILAVAYLAALHGLVSAEAKADDASLADLAIPSGLRGDELVLAEDGQPTAAIVIGRTADQPIRAWAEVLQQYVEQITGAKLPLVDDRAKGLPDVVVCVGPSALTGRVDDGQEASSQRDQLVTVRDGKVLLATAQSPRQSESVRYAVHELLRTFGAECYRGRWEQTPSASLRDPQQAKLYTIVPRTPTLTVATNLDIHIPAFLARMPGATLGPWGSIGGVPYDVAHNWGGAGLLPYDNINPDKYGKKHPEYFAVVPGVHDARVGRNRDGNAVCTTEPAVIDLFAVFAAKAFARGEQKFSLTPNDGIRTYCQCEDCVPDKHNPAPSADRLVRFGNAVRRKLDENHPQFKDRALHMLVGYGWPQHRIPPSDGVKALPGVVLWMSHQGCHAHRWDDLTCPLNRVWADQFRGWLAAAGSESLGNYEYACFSNYNWDRKWSSFPVVSVRRVVHDVAAYHRAGLAFLYYESEAGHRRYVPFRWVYAYACDRAMADPQINPDELLGKLCEDIYGPSAQVMYEYYDLLQTRLDQTPHHADNWNLPDPAKVYSPDDITRLTELVNQAVWNAQGVGGDVLQRCIEAQKVWYEAVASLKSPDRDKSGPRKQYSEPPW